MSRRVDPADLAPADRLRRWLADPTLQLLLVGLALFAVHRALAPEVAAPSAGSRRIAISDGDLRQLTLGWLAQGRPAPTPAQLASLVESRIREEILYREALALGLDRDDTIVRRRLAQKMEFLIDDVSVLREPGHDELRRWFHEHADAFALPTRVSFTHLYFSPDRRGAQARADALRVLARLDGAPVSASAQAALADRFMFQDVYGDRPVDEVAAVFGGAFAEALVGLPTGSWQGPVASGYGWHLVWLDSVTPSRVPDFEAVASEVRTAWIAERRAAARDRALEELRRRYEVDVPDLGASVPWIAAVR